MGVDGKVKQGFISYVSKEMNGSALRKVSSNDVRAIEVRDMLPLLFVQL